VEDHSLRSFRGPYASHQVTTAIVCALMAYLGMRHAGLPVIAALVAPRPLSMGVAADLVGIATFLGFVFPISWFRWRNWRAQRAAAGTLAAREIAFLTSLGNRSDPRP
jgi:hypothetical protein